MGHSFAMTSCPFSFPRRSASHAILTGVVLGLAACGGGSGDTPLPRATTAQIDLGSAPRFAQGPVGTACKIHNRQVATAQKCGCIQAAADMTLSQSQQQRAARFFAEPELLQQVKLSDTPPDERFWQTWARFAETAELLCESG